MAYYEVIHSSPEITTLGDYCSQIESPASKYIRREEEFLSIVDENNYSNRDRLFSLYTPTEENDNKTLPASELLLKVGTRFIVPIEEINVSGLLTQGIEVVSNYIPTFKADKLVELESDPNYQRSHKTIVKHGLSGSVVQSFPQATVWVWCKSLSKSEEAFKDGKLLDNIEGELIDITPFVQQVKTSVSQNGGNFSITLPPLVGELEITRTGSKTVSTWRVAPASANSYTFGNNEVGYSQKYWGQNNLFLSEGDGELIQNTFLFHSILQSNDLVFIRFETLDLERDQRYSDSESFIVNKQNIAGRVYDMIGLIDTNTFSQDSESNNVSIQIAGRDLIKLFIDDGTYFYNLENVTGQFRIAGKSTQDSELQGRLIGSNTLYYLSLYQNTSIEYILKFIIQQLSNISVVPDSLFFSYGDRRNTTFLENGDRIKKIQNYRNLEEEKKSLQSSIKDFKTKYDFLQELREKKVRLVSDSSTIGWSPFITQNGEKLKRNELPVSLYPKGVTPQITNNLGTTVNFNSLDSRFNDLQSDFNRIDKLLDKQRSQPKGDGSKFTNVLARGIWQIIKLAIDKNVSSRRIVDSSMSSANGSLLTFIRKICQDPFVEFYTDTYGDEFNIIVRKPPYDKKSVIDYLRSNINSEKNENLRPAVIDIEGESVENFSVMYTQEAYSWYSFKPQNVFASGGSILPTAYIPALYFEEYANIWGSQPLEIIHNYNPYVPIINKDGVVDISRFELQAFTDLKYLVESHAHLPFTRQGTITLAGTDRRIKKGNLIRYKPTGEIFLVDSVTHSMSISEEIQASTTIQVSRGMVEDLIYGIDVAGIKNVSYFNIINTDINLRTKKYEKTTQTRKGKKFVERKKENSTKVPKDDSINSIHINGIKLTQEQKDNARIIYNIGKSLNASDRDIQIAYIASIQDSSLRNIKGTSRSRVGLFQQVVDLWGTYSELSDPETSTRRFFTGVATKNLTGLLFIRNRYGLPLHTVAQRVQLTETEQSYIGWEETAQQLVDYFNNITKKTTESDTFLEEQETLEEVETPGYIGVDREAVFSSMKVNRDVFNFFLRNEQFSLNRHNYSRSEELNIYDEVQVKSKSIIV